jgi:hypothetical protein
MHLALTGRCSDSYCVFPPGHSLPSDQTAKRMHMNKVDKRYILLDMWWCNLSQPEKPGITSYVVHFTDHKNLAMHRAPQKSHQQTCQKRAEALRVLRVCVPVTLPYKARRMAKYLGEERNEA